jgi:hypothetical protein
MTIKMFIKRATSVLNQGAIWIGMFALVGMIWGIGSHGWQVFASCGVFWLGSFVAASSADVWEGLDE